MKRIVILHGNGGCSAESHWTPWLKAELEKHGETVIAPTMPDNIEAKASIWLPYMRDALHCDEKTIIIGHSSGAVAALRYAENNKILGSILIGVNYTDLGLESERISGYFDTPWKWEIIKKNQQWIILFSSTDDPYIPVEHPRYIHEKLASKYHEFTDQGHFMDNTLPSKALLVIFSKL